MFVRSQHFFRIPKGFFCNKALFRVCLLDELRVLVAKGRVLVGQLLKLRLCSIFPLQNLQVLSSTLQSPIR